MNAKMIGHTRDGKNGICSCCIPKGWRKNVKRAVKRRERQAWKKDLSNMRD